jgi:hypothetical protein
MSRSARRLPKLRAAVPTIPRTDPASDARNRQYAGGDARDHRGMAFASLRSLIGGVLLGVGGWLPVMQANVDNVALLVVAAATLAVVGLALHLANDPWRVE